MRPFYLKPVPKGSLTGITKGETATKKLLSKNTLHGILLECRKADGTGCSKAEIALDIENIKFEITDAVKGSVIPFNASIESAQMIFGYHHSEKSSYTDACVLFLDFTRGNSAYALGMRNVTSADLAVKFKSPTSLTIASVEVATIIREVKTINDAPGIGSYIEVRERTRTFASTGIEQVDNLPHNKAGTGLIGYHVAVGTAQIDNVLSYHDDELLENVSLEMRKFFNHGLRVEQQSGYCHIDFRRGAPFLPMGEITSFLQEFEWNAAAGAPGTYKIVTEYIKGLLIDIDPSTGKAA